MDKQTNQTPLSQTDVKTTAQAPSRWKAFLKKKWTFPALYLVAAALILALIVWYPNPDSYVIDEGKEQGEGGVEVTGPQHPTAQEPGETVPVNAPTQLSWPVPAGVSVSVVRGFFDDKADKAAQASALVKFDNTYRPNTGIDLATADKKPFDVLAAADGTVTRVEKDPLVGYVVEIRHNDKLTTVYMSLEDVKVASGAQVKKGDVIGKAGRSALEKELGPHLHFEVRENGEAVNPQKYLTQAGQPS
ncbi:M23 family metallopeptidase [Calditerricola satsumensis]|uniref:M23ase beta-sheet core domain-containing protein n=1 Tax=Calditerricola satsumensis TaxID=373054 RepID=A0A8J3F968_9BACI|nr:M23 family metallopeptidase [Calditerricola satsumensis]GGJ95970.1 hypothetical protein GCM10007043_07240 [Calditerricola satsumensis]